jgi:hypothetical protein
MLRILREKLSRKHETNKTVEVGVKKVQIVEPIRKGCMRCRFVILRDNWHIESNRCSLRNLMLGKEIGLEEGCEKFKERLI